MIVGIAGLIGSGKDTVAEYLIEKKGFERYSFASSLKDSIAAIFNWDRELLDGTTKESRLWRDQVDEWWAKRLHLPHLTPRWVLQYWGTEVCRRGFHDDIWIASIENKIRTIKDDVVITDCRFENELNVIKQLGGILIRVERGPEPEWCDSAAIVNLRLPGFHEAKNMLQMLNIHASEYSGIGLNYDYYLNNNGTLQQLYEQIESIINL